MLKGEQPMKIDFPIEQAVQKRYSVRNYKAQEVEPNVQEAIKTFVASLNNPFGEKVYFHFLDKRAMQNRQKLGTYGVIKGADQFIGTTISRQPAALVALGYEMEAVVLYLAHLGLGTCWLGGTFDRKGFAKAMNIEDDKMFPIMTPFGYPAAQKHLQETLMRRLIKADHRKEWKELFFKDDFQSPLPAEEAGDLRFPLEMVRLGPSASNKQPWRILVIGQTCHFYEYKTPGYSDAFSYDIQRVDMGIAAAHFDFAAKEKGMEGCLDTGNDPKVALPEHMEYVCSWVSACVGDN